MHLRLHPARFGAFLFISLTVASAARALDAGPVAVHGSLSLTAAYSDRYNYLGDTAKNLDPNVVEVTVNGSHRFENGLRAAAQLYTYEIDGYKALAIDFASLDYAFNQYVGLRVGRVKHAFGLYGDAQDVDILRPFAFLPSGVYDKTLRPTNAAYDGADLYGNLPLGKGSIDYQFYYGQVPKLDPKAPFFQHFLDGAPFSFQAIKPFSIYGAWIFWNTPLEGLRVGFSTVFLTRFDFSGSMKNASTLALANSDARVLPGYFPPGVWDGLVAGKTASVDSDVRLYYYSAEYTRGNWQFAAEAYLTENPGTTTMPILGVSTNTTKGASYYGMATWQAAPKLQLGTYYSVTYGDRTDRDGNDLHFVPGHIKWLKDFTGAVSYAVTPGWLIKAEVHSLNGTQVIGLKGNGDPAKWKADWTYLVVKTTFSF